MDDLSIFILGIYKFGSHAGFKSASESCGFYTQMHVWPTSGGSVSGSDNIQWL